MHAFFALAVTLMLAVAHVTLLLNQAVHIIVKPLGCTCM